MAKLFTNFWMSKLVSNFHKTFYGTYTVQRNITHSKEFAGNQGKPQN